MTTNNRKQLHERLWAAAEQLRANSGLKLSEIAEPILGLIFLKFADVRFKRTQADFVADRSAKQYSAGSARRQAPILPLTHIKQRVFYFYRKLPPIHI